VKAVPLLDLKAQFAPLRDEILPRIEELIDAQMFVLGEPVASFERALANYTGAKHAIGCASGTDALILALAASDVGPGDQVLTTPFSFFSTASCSYKVGARPLFCDIDPETFNIDVDAADAAMNSNVKAILPVHLFGQCADLVAFGELADRHGVALIEDAAQALGARYERGGQSLHAGRHGKIGCYSFFPTKNLGGFGDGGAMVTDDDQIADRLQQLRVHGGRQMYHHEWVGWNSRLDALQAVVLEIKLRHLDDWSNRRAANADRYDEWFAQTDLISRGCLKTPRRDPRAHHIFNQYTLRVERRDELREALTAASIGHSVYYPVSLHLQKCFEELGGRVGQFPHAERACEEVIALPIYPELELESQRRVVDTIIEFFS